MGSMFSRNNPRNYVSNWSGVSLYSEQIVEQGVNENDWVGVGNTVVKWLPKKLPILGCNTKEVVNLLMPTGGEPPSDYGYDVYIAENDQLHTIDLEANPITLLSDPDPYNVFGDGSAIFYAPLHIDNKAFVGSNGDLETMNDSNVTYGTVLSDMARFNGIDSAITMSTALRTELASTSVLTVSYKIRRSSFSNVEDTYQRHVFMIGGGELSTTLDNKIVIEFNSSNDNLYLFAFGQIAGPTNYVIEAGSLDDQLRDYNAVLSIDLINKKFNVFIDGIQSISLTYDGTLPSNFSGLTHFQRYITYDADPSRFYGIEMSDLRLFKRFVSTEEEAANIATYNTRVTVNGLVIEPAPLPNIYTFHAPYNYYRNELMNYLVPGNNDLFNRWRYYTDYMSTIAVADSDFVILQYGGRIYMIGGSYSGGETYYDFITTPATGGYYSIIHRGSGATYSYNLPVKMKKLSAVKIKDKVHMLAIYDGSSYLTTVYTTTLQTASPYWSQTFTTDSDPLPYPMSRTDYFTIGNKLYVVGIAYETTTDYGAVYSADIDGNSNLVNWTKEASLPVDLNGSRIITTKTRVYLIGGFNTTVSVNTVLYATIGTDGTLGTWTIDTVLPIGMSEHTVVMNRDKAYILPGRKYTTVSSSYALHTVYEASIDKDGVLSPFTAISKTPYNTSGCGVLVHGEFLYLLGKHLSNKYDIVRAPFFGGWGLDTYQGVAEQEVTSYDVSSLELNNPPENMYLTSSDILVTMDIADKKEGLIDYNIVLNSQPGYSDTKLSNDSYVTFPSYVGYFTVQDSAHGRIEVGVESDIRVGARVKLSDGTNTIEANITSAERIGFHNYATWDYRSDVLHTSIEEYGIDRMDAFGDYEIRSFNGDMDTAFAVGNYIYFIDMTNSIIYRSNIVTRKDIETPAFFRNDSVGFNNPDLRYVNLYTRIYIFDTRDGKIYYAEHDEDGVIGDITFYTDTEFTGEDMFVHVIYDKVYIIGGTNIVDTVNGANNKYYYSYDIDEDELLVNPQGYILPGDSTSVTHSWITRYDNPNLYVLLKGDSTSTLMLATSNADGTLNTWSYDTKHTTAAIGETSQVFSFYNSKQFLGINDISDGKMSMVTLPGDTTISSSASVATYMPSVTPKNIRNLSFMVGVYTYVACVSLDDSLDENDYNHIFRFRRTGWVPTPVFTDYPFYQPIPGSRLGYNLYYAYNVGVDVDLTLHPYDIVLFESTEETCAEISNTYNFTDGYFEKVFAGLERGGRALRRRLIAFTNGVEIKTPFTTELTKEG